MARIEIADGSDQQTTDLARAIIAAQSAEVEQMSQWRTQWYGAPSPAGGIPAMNETAMPAHDGMDKGSKVRLGSRPRRGPRSAPWTPDTRCESRQQARPRHHGQPAAGVA